MNTTLAKRLSALRLRRVNPTIKERLFQAEQRSNGPWVPASFLRAMIPITASFMLSVAALEQSTPTTTSEHIDMDPVRLASTNLSSASILFQVRPTTLEWNRLALATFASTNPMHSYSSNSSFFTNKLER